jgi:hypothetical protein
MNTKKFFLWVCTLFLLLTTIAPGVVLNCFASPVINRVNVNLALSPVSSVVVPGDTHVPLVGFTFTGTSLGPVIVKEIVFTGYIDDEGVGTSYEKGVSTDNGVVSISDVIQSAWVEDGSGNVIATLGAFSDINGRAVAGGLNFAISVGDTQTFTLYGDIFPGAGYGNIADRIAVDIVNNRDVLIKNPLNKIVPAQLVTRNDVSMSSPLVYTEVEIDYEDGYFESDYSDNSLCTVYYDSYSSIYYYECPDTCYYYDVDFYGYYYCAESGQYYYYSGGL